MSQKEQIERIFTYQPPKNDSQIERYKEIRNAGRLMAEIIVDACPVSEEYKIALQKIREAIMWANAAIACNE